MKAPCFPSVSPPGLALSEATFGTPRFHTSHQRWEIADCGTSQCYSLRLKSSLGFLSRLKKKLMNHGQAVDSSKLWGRNENWRLHHLHEDEHFENPLGFRWITIEFHSSTSAPRNAPVPSRAANPRPRSRTSVQRFICFWMLLVLRRVDIWRAN